MAEGDEMIDRVVEGDESLRSGRTRRATRVARSDRYIPLHTGSVRTCDSRGFVGEEGARPQGARSGSVACFGGGGLPQRRSEEVSAALLWPHATCGWVAVAFAVAACSACEMYGSFVAGSSRDVKMDRTGMPRLRASNAPTALPRRSSRRRTLSKSLRRWSAT